MRKKAYILTTGMIKINKHNLSGGVIENGKQNARLFWIGRSARQDIGQRNGYRCMGKGKSCRNRDTNCRSKSCYSLRRYLPALCRRDHKD